MITEGDQGKDLFFVYGGTAEAHKWIEGKDTVVMSYRIGDYFGERALIKNEPRAASIVATSYEL